MGAANHSNWMTTAAIVNARRGGGGGSGGPFFTKKDLIIVAVGAVVALSPFAWIVYDTHKDRASLKKSMAELPALQAAYVPERRGHLVKCYDLQGNEWWLEPRRIEQFQRLPTGQTEVLFDTMHMHKPHKQPERLVRDSIVLNLPSFEILEKLYHETHP